MSELQVAGERSGTLALATLALTPQAKGYLEKLILMTEPLRETPLWRQGGNLAAQATLPQP